MVVTLIVGYVVHVQGHPRSAQVLPFSNLIVVGNWQPLMVSVLAGLLWHRLPGARGDDRRRRSALVGACLLEHLSARSSRQRAAHGRPLGRRRCACRLPPPRAPPPPPRRCSSAHGIWTTEQEMALLCLTSDEGTQMHGLYRGLKIKTARHAVGRLHVLRRRRSTTCAARAGAAVASSCGRVRRWTRSAMQGWGWIPGVPHSVVLIGFIGDDSVAIADPSIGREIWSLDDLSVLWHGEGVRLVRAR